MIKMMHNNVKINGHFLFVFAVLRTFFHENKVGKEKEGRKGRGKAPRNWEGKAGRIFFWEASFPLH